MLEGNRARRPLPANEPQYPAGVPERPSGMSAGGRKIWDMLVGEMAASGVLRTVDALALMQLCEDQATMDTLRKGMAEMTREISRKAKEKKMDLPGGALIQLSRTIEGRRTLSTIREMSAQIIVQRREFGLTPASNGRVQTAAGAGASFIDPLEQALCG
jgi:phage terminase small subunit